MNEASIQNMSIAGAGGGVIFWAWSLLHGGLPGGDVAPFPPQEWLWISLVLTAIVGAGAALVMQVVAATERTQKYRAIVFAVLCGFCWEPALSGVLSSFTMGYADREAQHLVEEAQAIPVDPEGAVDSSRASALAMRLLEISPQLQNPILKEQISQQTEQLFNVVEQDVDPTTRAEGLERMGIAAAEAGQTAFVARTATSLRELAATHPDSSARVQSALTVIDDASQPVAPEGD